ncbi:MAG: hypothetical protein JHC95_18825 [Solirubrobacteraceae bacterium]|nr:hypothetical protein [Solirubrobacteraceae bacterium]
MLRAPLFGVFGGALGIAAVAAARLLGSELNIAWFLGAAVAAGVAGLLAARWKGDIALSVVSSLLAFAAFAGVIVLLVMLAIGAALNEN